MVRERVILETVTSISVILRSSMADRNLSREILDLRRLLNDLTIKCEEVKQQLDRIEEAAASGNPPQAASEAQPPIHQPEAPHPTLPYDKKSYSHKNKPAGFSYEIGVSLDEEGRIVW
jgi:hypothetical protein